MFFILIELNIVHTLILSIILFLIGGLIKSKISFFDKFCIPAPVIGGILFCFLSLILRFLNIFIITMDTSLMSYFISFFFTTVGLGISLSIVKKGGKQLATYWVLCGVLAFCQNVLAIILSKFTNIHPLLGLMCGTIAMEGGHGSAAAFGATIENLGITNAISVGVAAATFGLLFAGILGGPVSKYLITKFNLASKPVNSACFNKSINKSLNSSNLSFNTNSFSFLEQILVIFVCIVFGEFFSNIIYKATDIIIPSITGCMLISVVVRNINNKVKILNLDFKLIDLLSDISLGIFLTMALMSIDLFKLSNLFGPILLIVVSQAIFIVLFAIFIMFKALGKDLDAAIMVSGLIGHGLGATPNALANMNSVSEKYGSSKKAFLIVPLVAAFLLDIFTMPCIIFFINIFS